MTPNFLLPLLLLSLDDVRGVQQEAVFFCGFSSINGWDKMSGERIIARVASEDDPSGIPQVIRKIERALGARLDIKILISNSSHSNAYATVARGQRYLLTDTRFLDRTNNIGQSGWAAIEVLSHEVGHFISGTSRGTYANELNADYWSGLILFRLGASKAAASSALERFADKNDGTYPARARRISAVEEGWEDASAGRINYERCDRCKPSQP